MRISRVLRRLYDFRIRTRLLIGFGVVVLVNLALNGVTVLRLSDLRDLVITLYDKPLMASTYALRAKLHFSKFEHAITDIFISNNASELNRAIDQSEESLEILLEDLEVVKERSLGEESKKTATELAEKIEVIQKIKGQVLRSLTSSHESATPDLTKLKEAWKTNPLRGEIQEGFSHLTDLAAEAGYQFREISEKETNESISLFITRAITAFILTMLSFILLYQSVVRPLKVLTGNCERARDGNYDDIRKVSGRKNEMAVLSKSFAQMIQQIKIRRESNRALLNSLTSGKIPEVDRGQKVDHISTHKLEKLKNALNDEDILAARSIFSTFDQHPVSEIFDHYVPYVESLSADLKKEIRVEFDSNSDEVAFREVRRLDSILCHLVRMIAQKPETGMIRFSARRETNQIVLILADDGQGIALEKLRELAVSRRLWNETKAAEAAESEVMNLIFEPSLSKKNQIPETSNDEMGMEAIKNAVEFFGGQIVVHSQTGKGTRFEITIPLATGKPTARASLRNTA